MRKPSADGKAETGKASEVESETSEVTRDFLFLHSLPLGKPP
jgi:hypothetical protein